jgi:hypothetical protein
MNKRHFSVGLVHGVVATASGAPPPQIADAFDAAEIIRVAADPHALLISNVPLHYRGHLEADTLFSDPARVSALAVAHHRILQAAVMNADVVPIRLGTVVTGPAGARNLLTREAGRFADHLAAIHGAVEFGVRILPVPGAARQVSQIQAGSGRDYLRARRDQRAHSRPAIVDTALQQLALRAQAMRERQLRPRPGQPPPLADAAFLIDRRKLAAFIECAARIERRFAADGLGLDLLGPLPAYSFVASCPEDQG